MTQEGGLLRVLGGHGGSALYWVRLEVSIAVMGSMQTVGADHE